jgi:hypothetical protein
MKDSHLTTPRTLGECQFQPSMDPIERATRHRFTPVQKALAAAYAFAAIVLVLTW